MSDEPLTDAPPAAPEPEPEPQPTAEEIAAANDAAIDHELRRRTRRDFIVAGVAAAAGIGAWEWLKTRPTEDGVPWPLRRVLEFNERVAGAYFSPRRLSPEYDA